MIEKARDYRADEADREESGAFVIRKSSADTMLAGAAVFGQIPLTAFKIKSGSSEDWPVSKSQGIIGSPLHKSADKFICLPVE